MIPPVECCTERKPVLLTNQLADNLKADCTRYTAGIDKCTSYKGGRQC